MLAANVALRGRQGERKALGLPWYGGRPSGVWKRLKAGDKGALLAMADELIKLLPPGPVDKPIEEWTHSELLSDGARLGLMRDREMASWEPVDSTDPNELKRNRLIHECGSSLYNRLAVTQASALQIASADKGWDELLARLAQNQKKAKKTEG